MTITSLQVGPIMTNCYIVTHGGQTVVVDPGDESRRIIAAVEATGCPLAAIWLTHGHFDHWTAVAGLLAQWPRTPVYIHPDEVEDAPAQGDWALKFPRLGQENQRFYHEGDSVSVGDATFSVMETPGHSAGSVCLLGQGVIFCGDTLFRGSCGRTDLPDGSYTAMLLSLGRLGRLPGDYRCLCGHEEETTLALERQYNPYLRQGMGL